MCCPRQVSPNVAPVSNVMVFLRVNGAFDSDHQMRRSCQKRAPLLSLRGGSSRDSIEVDAAQDRADQNDSEDIEWLAVDIEYSCSGRSDLITTMIDVDSRIIDFKRSLHANYSNVLCSVDRMQLLWQGHELFSVGDETFSLYGLDKSVSRPRLLLKESAADRYQDSMGRGFSLDGPLSPGYGSAPTAMGGDPMRDPMASSMLSMLSDPLQLKYFIENNPQMQEMMKSNPELRQIMSDPEALRRVLQVANNPGMMRSMLEQQDRMLFNVMGQPG
eukprot:CAMPEP_0172168126 /NCGR_PEP_ID=MMETSP1050-20130122/9959_1 /TAXON_ID=233186 /ORGANISM="Cryptomonas curvata, Strain CCAP979/52" /LENGTH=272 /DNA_ID=CAMNT_0012839003 /DNA_START=112 /DNA_END=926 /DNA_ORIENTATION=-